MTKCRLRISRRHYRTLMEHLFPGDFDEHGAVLLAGFSNIAAVPTFVVREVHPCVDGVDYVAGEYGHRAVSPKFIHRLITRARDERLAYLAVHNHGSDRRVAFSRIDYESHERGYPALLQIARGMPVGALVFGGRSVEADLWLNGGQRLALENACVVGKTLERLTPGPTSKRRVSYDVYDRQIRMFGQGGQVSLRRARVALIGLGGVGSIVAEYLGRLGVGDFLLIDPDRVEASNLSRIVGASGLDAQAATAKVDIAERLILQANPTATVTKLMDDVAKESVARLLVSCDFMFLAADSMRARLVFNAVVHQYLIPGAQLGSKIRSRADGSLLDVFSANRAVRPGEGCLWCNQLIDPTELAKEAKSDADRKAQEYGVQEPNPSVVSVNAISAAHAVNDFLFDYLGLASRHDEPVTYEHFHLLTGKRSIVTPRSDPECSECSERGLRYGRGDTVSLPCLEG